jgi:hypothetical protein
MQRFLVHCANGFLLIVVLVGIPAITSARFGNWQLSSAPRAQMLTLWGLAAVAVVNAVVALGPIKGRKERVLCWKWAAAFGVLLLTQYLLKRGYINFDWLRQVLEWVQKRF